MTAPFFSICIPNYNYGRFIGETIQSVLDQDYDDYEIVIADNASTDNSLDVIESFAARDARIRVIRNRHNIGFAPNLQRATETARGQYMNLLSSDDQMKAGALRAYAAAIRETGVRDAVLFAAVENFDERGQVFKLTVKPDDGFYLRYTSPNAPPSGAAQVFDGSAVLASALKRLKTPMPFLSTVYARTLWERIEGYNSTRTIGPDKHFIYKVLGLNPPVVYIPRVCYRYRDAISPNKAAQTTTLKQPMDDYLYTLEYRDETLAPLGLTRQDLIEAFIERVCLREGLSQLGHRHYAHAFKLLMFALASYPGTTLRRPKAYALAGLLATGPLASIIAPVLLSVYYREHPNEVREATVRAQG